MNTAHFTHLWGWKILF